MTIVLVFVLWGPLPPIFLIRLLPFTLYVSLYVGLNLDPQTGPRYVYWNGDPTSRLFLLSCRGFSQFSVSRMWYTTVWVCLSPLWETLRFSTRRTLCLWCDQKICHFTLTIDHFPPTNDFFLFSFDIPQGSCPCLLVDEGDPTPSFLSLPQFPILSRTRKRGERRFDSKSLESSPATTVSLHVGYLPVCFGFCLCSLKHPFTYRHLRRVARTSYPRATRWLFGWSSSLAHTSGFDQSSHGYLSVTREGWFPCGP